MNEHDTDAARGLTSSDVKERLERFGPNRLVEERRVTFLAILWEEVREPMILLLLVVAVFYSVWGVLEDVITIIVVIALLILAEVFTEYRAKRAIVALTKLTAPQAPVMRDGRFQEVQTADLVPGDVILLRVGERVPADAKLVGAIGLEVDESTLTGESFPVRKETEAEVTGETPLAERADIVFAGTVVTHGKGTAIVIGTGMDTELGRIAGLTRAVKEPKTRLQLAMKQLAGWLVYVAVSISIIIPIVGIAEGKPYKTMILTGLGLAFATVPEELPIIITMVLGLGAFQLSRHHALVKRLRAAETLGGVTVIATDKTGTLTENRMTLVRLKADGASYEPARGPLMPAARRLLEMGVLVNDVDTKKEDSGFSYFGDPMEVALVRGAVDAGVDPEEVGSRYHLTDEFSFDTHRKMMSAVLDSDGARNVFVKGAPEAILDRSVKILRETGEAELDASGRDEVRRQVDSLAEDGLRVVAFAYRDASPDEPLSREEAETGLTFAGTAGFADPPREDVPRAIRESRKAGIRVMMVTGDHSLTSRAVARSIGLDSSGKVVTGIDLDKVDDDGLKRVVEENSVFTRTTPEHKLRIVRALQVAGEIVAVTGDGVNDAPALREADIGIAMGETGTDVAREASDMVLTDDNFATITFAVRQGRKLFDNLRKGVRYYLAVKLGLVLVFILPTILGTQLPFAPIQIIVLELFMDLAASATFVAEPAEKDVMTRHPRDPQGKFMNRMMLQGIVSGGLALFAAVMTVYLVCYYALTSADVARSAAFATWIIGHIALAYSMRSDRESIVSLGFFSNKVMIVWTVAALAFLVLAVNVPVLEKALKLTSLTGGLWLFSAGTAVGFAFLVEVFKSAMKRWRPAPSYAAR